MGPSQSLSQIQSDWWSCFLLGNTNDGLIDCYSLQAVRCKRAKQVENSLVLHMALCFIHPIHSDNAANVIWLVKKRLDTICDSGCDGPDTTPFIYRGAYLDYFFIYTFQAFFFRNWSRRDGLICEGSGNCQSVPGSGLGCPACRMKRCIKAGMSLTGNPVLATPWQPP